uniref:Microneme protein Etmic-2 n=1 Tax=Eimeria tenella TaxID=5802 RepID=O96994_EIMTE|nr:microneme protein Etmic-2 [Eimeria tenella]
MARALSLVALGLLFSLPPSSAVRTRVPGEDSFSPESGVLSGTDAPERRPNAMRTCVTTFCVRAVVPGLVEGNCGRLTVRNGLSVDETIKVTSAGWTKSERDFIVSLVADETRKVVQLRESEGASGASGPGPAPAEKPPSGQGSAEEAPKGEGGQEKPSVPLIAVRIHGSGGDKGESAPQSAVLLYGNDESEPTEVPLETAAGPTTPLMVLITQQNPKEVEVRVLAWISTEYLCSRRGVSRIFKYSDFCSLCRDATTGKGSWKENSVVVGSSLSGRDLTVNLSDCGPSSLRVYGSASADLVTVKEGMCEADDPELIALTRPHTSAASPLPAEEGDVAQDAQQSAGAQQEAEAQEVGEPQQEAVAAEQGSSAAESDTQQSS